MLSENELRIGNYVDVNPKAKRHNERYITIESIGIGSINIDFREYDIDDLLPIPLTPEILEKCGFKIYSKHSFWTFKLINGWCISMWMESTTCAGFEEYGVCYWGDNYKSIKHLHQLQNLYFALTGEELIVNI